METNLKAAPAWILPDDPGVPSIAALGSAGSRRRADHPSLAKQTVPTMATREYRIPNLARACHVLRLFAASDEYLSSSAVARQLKMPRTTVLRILHTLAAERLLQRHGFDFTASPELRTGLRSLTDTAVRAAAAPVLKELSQVTGETAYLALLAGDKVVTTRTMRPRDYVGLPRIRGHLRCALCRCIRHRNPSLCRTGRPCGLFRDRRLALARLDKRKHDDRAHQHNKKQNAAARSGAVVIRSRFRRCRCSRIGKTHGMHRCLIQLPGDRQSFFSLELLDCPFGAGAHRAVSCARFISK